MKFSHFRPSSALVLLVWLSAGCAGQPLNISDAPRVQDLKLLGSCLVLKQDAPLFQVGKPYRRLTFRASDQPAAGGPGKHIATIRAGTRLQVVKVERGPVYFDGLFTQSADLTFARIDSGEHTGKVVELGWRVLTRIEDVPAPFAQCESSH